MPLTPEQLKAAIDAIFQTSACEATHAVLTFEWQRADDGEGVSVSYVMDAEPTKNAIEEKVYFSKEIHICVWCDERPVDTGHAFCNECEKEMEND